MNRIFLVTLAIAGAACGAERSNGRPDTPASVAVDRAARARADHPLRLFPRLPSSAVPDKQNEAGSPAAEDDRVEMTAIVAAFSLGEADALYLQDVTCDREAATCEAKDALGGTNVTAQGRGAKKVIEAFVKLDAQGNGRRRCDRGDCSLAELACYVDRGTTTYTCDDSRR